MLARRLRCHLHSWTFLNCQASCPRPVDVHTCEASQTARTNHPKQSRLDAACSRERALRDHHPQERCLRESREQWSSPICVEESTRQALPATMLFERLESPDFDSPIGVRGAIQSRTHSRDARLGRPPGQSDPK